MRRSKTREEWARKRKQIDIKDKTTRLSPSSQTRQFYPHITLSFASTTCRIHRAGWNCMPSSQQGLIVSGPWQVFARHWCGAILRRLAPLETMEWKGITKYGCLRKGNEEMRMVWLVSGVIKREIEKEGKEGMDNGAEGERERERLINRLIDKHVYSFFLLRGGSIWHVDSDEWWADRMLMIIAW